MAKRLPCCCEYSTNCTETDPHCPPTILAAIISCCFIVLHRFFFSLFFFSSSSLLTSSFFSCSLLIVNCSQLTSCYCSVRPFIFLDFFTLFFIYTIVPSSVNEEQGVKKIWILRQNMYRMISEEGTIGCFFISIFGEFFFFKHGRKICYVRMFVAFT